LVLVALLGGCGSDADQPAAGSRACSMVVPAACSPPAPSYTTQVSAIVAQHCEPCHKPGGEEQKRPLLSYKQVFAIRGDILFQVSRCKMPPPDQPALTDDEIKALFDWLVCDAPEN
jgi:mono/diheme cytochrome c family protein